MNLYKIDIWAKENDWQSFYVLSDNHINAIDMALENIEENEVIDVLHKVVKYNVPVGF